MTTARTAYTAGTPDRPTFFPAPEDDPRQPTVGASHARSSLASDEQLVLQGRGFREKLTERWDSYASRVRDVWKSNTGMLLIGAAQVSWLANDVCRVTDVVPRGSSL